MFIGLIKNARQDYLEFIPCLDIIPEDRPDWEKYCIGMDSSIPNHRSETFSTQFLLLYVYKCTKSILSGAAHFVL